MDTTHTSATSPVRSTVALGGDLTVPRLGYGAMQLAGPGVIGLPEDITGAIAVLRSAVERGVRFFDTANAYGPRTVNQLIARALRHIEPDVSDEIVIGNKVGAGRGPAGEWLVDGRPETIRRQVEEALLDLRTETGLLTYLRLPGDTPAPPGAPATDVPLEESLGTLIELREAGKIRHIGLSGASPERLQRALALTPIAAVQNRFNLIDRSGVEVLATCERAGIAFVPYFPLATGAVTTARALADPARRLGVPPTTIALAWLLRRSPVIIPIPGTRSVSHLEDNLQAVRTADLLTPEEVQTLTAVEDENLARLDTMSDQMVAAVGREAAGPRVSAVARRPRQ